MSTKLKQANALCQLEVDHVTDLLQFGRSCKTDPNKRQTFKNRCKKLVGIYDEFQSLHSSIISAIATTKGFCC